MSQQNKRRGGGKRHDTQKKNLDENEAKARSAAKSGVDIEEATPLKSVMAMVAYFAALLPIGVSISRTLVLARGDSETFIVLLQTLNATAIIVSTIIALWPVVVFGVMAIISYRLSTTLVKIVAAPAIYGVGFFLFDIVGAVAAILGLAAGVYVRWAIRNMAKEKRPYTLFSLLFLITGSFSAVSVIPHSTASWLPPEQIKVNGRQEQTVYVLAVEEENTSILHYEGNVEIIRNELIQERQYCRLPKSEFRMPYMRDGIPIGYSRPTRSTLIECPLR